MNCYALDCSIVIEFNNFLYACVFFAKEGQFDFISEFGDVVTYVAFPLLIFPVKKIDPSLFPYLEIFST